MKPGRCLAILLLLLSTLFGAGSAWAAELSTNGGNHGERPGAIQPLGEFAPGLIADSFFSLDRDIMTIPDVVVGRQVMDLSMPLDDLLQKEQVYEGQVGYLLTGFLRIDDYGTQEVLVNITSERGGTCGAASWINGKLLASEIGGARRARFSLSVLGKTTLQPGLYPARLWIACRVPDRKSLVIEVLQRSPGEADFHLPERYQFVHEFR